MTNMFDRQPPYSPEAETAVIGGMLIDRTAAEVAIEKLTPESFYREANRRVFRAMTRLFGRGAVLDVLTVAEELNNTGELSAAGGWDYLGSLVDAVPTAANIEHHAKIVSDRATLRRLVDAASLTIRDVYDVGERTSVEVVAAAEERILAVAKSSQARSYAQAKHVIWPLLEEIEHLQDRVGQDAPIGLPTGIRSLDKKILGLHPGEVTVIAARPSMGKTALGFQLALHAVTLTPAVPALVFSFEMTAKELVRRAVANVGAVDLFALRGGRELASEEQSRLATAAAAVHAAPLFIDDSADSHVTSVAARARRACHTDGVRLVVLDYLQLMNGEGDNRQQEIGYVSRRVKAMAKELEIPVLLLSQLSRGPEGRTSKRPILSDLRESGDIEQDADNVLMLFRPEYYMTEDEVAKAKAKGKDPTGLVEIIVPKQRNGPTGTLVARFHKPTTRFIEREEGDE